MPNSYTAFARASHRKERESISDRPDRHELTAQEFLLHKAVRQAILNASIYEVRKDRIAAVVERTLRDHAFQANVKP